MDGFGMSGYWFYPASHAGEVGENIDFLLGFVYLQPIGGIMQYRARPTKKTMKNRGGRKKDRKVRGVENRRIGSVTRKARKIAAVESARVLVADRALALSQKGESA